VRILASESFEAESSARISPLYIYILFFLSGLPALIYQIVWQRSLFSIYGVNIESVTMVVSAFMLGLGLGSLLGGIISTAKRVPLLAIFGLVELGIGVFGLASLRLFHWVALFTAGVPPIQTGLISFVLVVMPTVLMGCTLPLLVAHVAQLSRNMGQSVGMLYAVNTLGSAGACFLAATITMRFLGQSGSVAVAAAINFSVASGALVLYLLSRRRIIPKLTPSSEGIADPVHDPDHLLRLPLAMVLVGLAGFISLSYEIVWYRIYSFTSGGQAKSFAYLLGGYLAGIAFGSLVSRWLCHDSSVQQLPRYLRMISVFIIMANLLGFLVVPSVSSAVRFVRYTFTLPLIAVAAGLLGAIFPLICHVSVKPDTRAGAGLSYLYLSNIIGSALGSFLVGFVLMDVLSLEKLSVFLALAGVALGLALLLATGPRDTRQVKVLAGGAALALLIVFSAGPLFDQVYERMQYKGKYHSDSRFLRIVETKSGVITVTQDGTVFGGGIYDGRFNVDPMHDTNGIVRAYALSSFHPSPKEVLMIGLSSGSWAEVIANHPQVEKLTIVEINPGYLRLIPLYSEVAGLIRNPKVEVVIDDGRRWLLRNPQRKFDVIVMNTTFHWRAQVTNLLSVEFLRLIRAHLKPGGVHFYNTTLSEEVQITGVTVFPYGLRLRGFLAVSDSPIHVDRERWRNVLTTYRIEGKPVFELTKPEHRQRLEEILSYTDIVADSRYEGMEYAETIRQRLKGKRMITDDNMGTEWTFWPVPADNISR
jgi:spermidine synthase